MSAVDPSPMAARELGGADPSFRSIFLAGAPRFARELFGPVVAFYIGWKLGNLATGIVLASVVGIAVEVYERRHGRSGALALVSVAFVLVQAAIGLIADSAVVYLAQPVIAGAIWGIANIVSALIGRPLAGVFADSWYSFPPIIKSSRTYRRVFGIESIVWGGYLLARSGFATARPRHGEHRRIRPRPVRHGIPIDGRARRVVGLVRHGPHRAKHGMGRARPHGRGDLGASTGLGSPVSC